MNNDKSFVSFADLLKSTKPAAEAQVPIIQVTEATPTNSFNTNDAAPTTTPIAAPTTGFSIKGAASLAAPKTSSPSPSPSNKKLVLMKMIDDNVLDFQCNTKDFLKEGSTVNVTKRKENFEILDNIKAYANGEKGLLGDDDSQLFKAQVQDMIGKLGGLKSKEKNKQLNREVHGLAIEMLGLWA
jgi:hypothetical protein